MKFNLIILSLLLLSFIASAQLQLSFTAAGGIGYVTGKKATATYNSIFCPGGGMALTVPLSNRVLLETGLGYIQKGYDSRERVMFNPGSTEYAIKARYQYLCIPLMAGYKLNRNPYAQSWIDFGMNYGFYITGKAQYTFSDYFKEHLINSSTFAVKPKGGFPKSDYNQLPTDKHAQISALDVMLKLQYRFIIARKYIVGLFYEHSLYAFTINTRGFYATDAKFRTAGLLLGYSF